MDSMRDFRWSKVTYRELETQGKGSWKYFLEDIIHKSTSIEDLLQGIEALLESTFREQA